MVKDGLPRVASWLGKNLLLLATFSGTWEPICDLGAFFGKILLRHEGTEFHPFVILKKYKDFRVLINESLF
jgi:hypothetical protein